MRQSQLILGNAAIIWVSEFLNLFPQLILVPYLIGKIGESGYGVFVLVWSLIMSIDHLQLSLQQGVVKYCAGYIAQKRMDEVNKIVSSSSIYSIFLAIAVFFIVLIVAQLYKDPTGQIVSVLFVVAIMILFIIPLTPYIAVIQSRQRYYVGAIASTGSKYLSLIAIILWYSIIGSSIEVLVIIMAGMLFLSKLVQVPIAYRLVPGLQNRSNLFNWTHFRAIGLFGATTVLISLCLAANSTGIRWLMGSLVSSKFVAHLVIMIMPGLLLYQLIGAMSITVMPATSSYEAIGNKRMLQELLLFGIRYPTILSISVMIAASLLMKEFFRIWVGKDYLFLVPYAIINFIGLSLRLSSAVSHQLLKGMGKLREVLIIYFIGLVIAPICFILLIYFIIQNPYLAVTIGLTTGNIICCYLNIVYSTKATQVNMRTLLFRGYIQPIIIAIPISIIAIGIVASIEVNDLLVRVGISVLTTALYLGACYLWITTEIERKRIRSIIKDIVNKSSEKQQSQSRQAIKTIIKY